LQRHCYLLSIKQIRHYHDLNEIAASLWGRALVATVILSILAFVLFPSSPLFAWLLAYGYDKGIAEGTRTRIPETVLLGLALIGGTLGAFTGMMLFRHKTSKPTFLIPFALIVVLQFALIGAWLILGQGG
jgi:uncharacterized membrane protein YsdA (DUF1294 family)